MHLIAHVVSINLRFKDRIYLGVTQVKLTVNCTMYSMSCFAVRIDEQAELSRSDVCYYAE